jgi:hypothetical protein
MRRNGIQKAGDPRLAARVFQWLNLFFQGFVHPAGFNDAVGVIEWQIGHRGAPYGYGTWAMAYAPSPVP